MNSRASLSHPSAALPSHRPSPVQQGRDMTHDRLPGPKGSPDPDPGRVGRCYEPDGVYSASRKTRGGADAWAPHARGQNVSERKNLKKENEIPQGQVSQSVPAPAASARKPIAKGAKGARGGSRGQEEGVLGPSRGTLLFKY